MKLVIAKLETLKGSKLFALKMKQARVNAYFIIKYNVRRYVSRKTLITDSESFFEMIKIVSELNKRLKKEEKIDLEKIDDVDQDSELHKKYIESIKSIIDKKNKNATS